MPQRTYSLSDLRARPQFAGTVADRIWNAWWRHKGHPRSFISERVDAMLHADGIPATLVAHDRDTFMGSTCIIESDMDARPQYSPWVAAVWVEPEFRQAGVGSKLVRTATQTAFALGFETLYLCAVEKRSRFYERLGWRKIEENVSGLNVFSQARPTGNAATRHP